MTAQLLQQALAAHQAGDLTTAEQGYRAVLQAMPDEPDATALLAVALSGLGRTEEAAAMIARAVELDPTAALFRMHQGNILMAAGNVAGGVAAFEKANQLAPHQPEIIYDLGNALREAGRSEEAKARYREVVALAPDHREAWNNLAVLFEQEGQTDEALQIFQDVVNRFPDYWDGWLNLSGMAEKAGQYELALSAAQKAHAMKPQEPRPYLGIGVAYNRMGRDDEALPYYLEGLRLKPDWSEVWDNLGQTYQQLNRLDEAEDAFRRCIACAGQTIEGEDTRRVAESEYGNRHWHLALLELLKGDYKRGFARYRARFEELDGLAREPWPRPVWQGEDVRGKKILVMDEQGMGDCLMMARYLPLLKERGATVYFYIAKALVPLFQGWSGADLIIPRGETIPDFDYYASIFDLPYGFGTTLETVPAKVPFLPILPPDAETQLPEEKRLKVGVVWAGAPLHKHDFKRSLALNVAKDLFAEEGIAFYSFNRDKREGDEALLAQLPVMDLAPRLRNFADTSRLMGQMDLIISCDTSTAHLAGGMGKPCWVLLPFAPDWRWLLGREDSPWYPTARVFRQEIKGDWPSVLARVRAALRDQVRAKAST